MKASLLFSLIVLVAVVSACGVKGDPVSTDEEAVISNGVQNRFKNNKRSNSDKEDDEIKKKQNR